jgi:hypothetical protein
MGFPLGDGNPTHPGDGKKASFVFTELEKSHGLTTFIIYTLW